ncbi:MAG: hypothetical protein K2L80_09530, partial [Muribaculaceae bacterium]|nr:hypothetical protein [Muribaculaceae bacterium]
SKGLYPLLGITALTNFIGLFYSNGISLVTAIERGVVDFGTYFAAYFLGTLLIEQLIPNIVAGEPNRKKIETCSAYAIAMLAIIRIIENCVPTDLTLIKLLPVFVALVIYKADRYLAVKPGDDLRFLLIGFVSLIVTPLLLHYILFLVIP